MKPKSTRGFEEAYRVDAARIRAELKEGFRKVFGAETPFDKVYDPADFIYFAPLPTVSREEEERLRREVERLGPFFQGPFPITRNLTVMGTYDGRLKCRQILTPVLPDSLAGKRVLEIACNAGFDSFFINLRRPREYLAIDACPVYYEQATFLNSLYRAGIDFRCLSWKELSPDVHGVFDLVVCIGLLYHETSMMELLAKMHELTAPGGMVILGTAVVAAELGSPVAVFIESTYRGDPSVWWIPSASCVEAMLRAAGFSEPRLTSKLPDPSLNRANPARTVEGWPAGDYAYFLAHRAGTKPPVAAKPPDLPEQGEWEAQLSSALAALETLEARYYRERLEQTRAALQAVYATLNNSLSWRFANRVGRMAARLCPPGSRRRRLYDVLVSTLKAKG